MGSEWRDCIVTYIDVIGTKKQEDPASRMRELHSLVVAIKPQLMWIDHAYTWNDSVLLLGFVDQHPGSVNVGPAYVAVMRDADLLKRRIDEHFSESYAIAVKGQTFPPLAGIQAAPSSIGVTVIRASGWAMANCFEIELAAKSGKWQKPWYVDGRIARKIKPRQGSQERKVKMFVAKGRRETRAVYVFDGYLWDSGAGISEDQG